MKRNRKDSKNYDISLEATTIKLTKQIRNFQSNQNLGTDLANCQRKVQA